MTASGSTAARPKPRSLRWESERARRDRWIALGTIAAVAIALFWPIVVGLLTGEPRFFEWDVPEQYWPDLVYLCDALHEGELPLWNPYDRLGYPYLADPQSGAYHPLNWSLCAVGGSSPHWGFAVFRVVFGFVLCGGFGLMWLRRLEFPWSSSVAGAAMLMCAPFMRHNWELNLTSALAWLPLMLWAAEGLVRRRRIWDGALLAFAFGLCAWTGSPPALWHASTFTLLYTVARLWPGLRAFRQLRTRPIDPSVTQKERARTFDLVRAPMVALVLAIGFVAPVFVPGLELADWLSGGRAGLGRDKRWGRDGLIASAGRSIRQRAELLQGKDGRVDSILANVERGTEQTNEVLDGANGLVNGARLQRTMRNLDSTLASVARDIDPVYGQAFDKARAVGVEATSYACTLSDQAIDIHRRIPIED